MQNYLPKIIAIVGPTASGKTDLAINLAKYLSNLPRIGANKYRMDNKNSRGIRYNSGDIQAYGAEIVSADSRQVYKGMDIGTGKVTKRKMAGIPHHLLDVASPQRTFTVAQYQKLGTAAIKKILSRDKLPIIVGGTGFYIDTLLYNYNLPSVKPNPRLRHALEKKSAEELFDKLKSLDPGRAETIDSRNKVRLIRALEIVLATKKPVPKLALWQVNGKKPLYDFLKIGIKLPDSELKKRIKKRVDRMIKKGLVGEVEVLIKKYGSKQIAFDAIGYREIINYLAADKRRLKTQINAHNISVNQHSNQRKSAYGLEKAMEEIKRNTTSFAKRQMTWFRKDKEIKWVRKEKEALRLVKKFFSK